MTQQYLIFEHPLNERIRTFLRMEHLFQLAKYRLNNLLSIWDAKDCVSIIIELYNLVERTDFRSELVKEIERHINSLQRLAKTPSIDVNALNNVLRDLEIASDILKAYSVKQGLLLHSEFLNGIRQRLIIPGGTCSFDLPAFHYWLHLPMKTRLASLHQWLEALEPLEKSLSLVMEFTSMEGVLAKRCKLLICRSISLTSSLLKKP